jgi:hypothetical protein
MCILFLYVGTENNPTIIANNRDEYFSRATNRGVFSTNYPPQGQVNDEENDEEKDDIDFRVHRQRSAYHDKPKMVFESFDFTVSESIMWRKVRCIIISEFCL